MDRLGDSGNVGWRDLAPLVHHRLESLERVVGRVEIESPTP
jgi:hypothetical protein